MTEHQNNIDIITNAITHYKQMHNNNTSRIEIMKLFEQDMLDNNIFNADDNYHYAFMRCNKCYGHSVTYDDFYDCITNILSIEELLIKVNNTYICPRTLTKGKLEWYEGIHLTNYLNDQIIEHIENNIITKKNIQYPFQYMYNNKKITGQNVDTYIMKDIAQTFNEFKGIKNIRCDHDQLYDHILIIYKNKTGTLWHNGNSDIKDDPIFKHTI
jgi:hypothetical protein